MASSEKAGQAAREGYEPPVVEDLETGRGPIETAAGAAPPSSFDENVNLSAPREI